MFAFTVYGRMDVPCTAIHLPARVQRNPTREIVFGYTLFNSSDTALVRLGGSDK
jgi:hypothetical protein